MDKLLLIIIILLLMRVSVSNDQQQAGVHGINIVVEKQTLINQPVELICSLKSNTNYLEYNYPNNHYHFNDQKLEKNSMNNVQQGHQTRSPKLPKSKHFQMIEREQKDSVMLINWYKDTNSRKPFLTINVEEMLFDDTAAILGQDQPLLLPPLIVSNNNNKNNDSIPDLQKVFDFDDNSELIINGLRESLYNRATYRVDFIEEKAFLTINNVQIEDEGIYRCNVDFQHAISINTLINLVVVVPPNQVYIYDYNNKTAKNGLMGPYVEDEHVVLLCETEKVKPIPKVFWFEGVNLVDDTFELISKHLNKTFFNERHFLPDNYLVNHFQHVRNNLQLNPLKRSDLLKEFRCQAMNTDLVKPISETVRLDMILAPIFVNIIYIHSKPIIAKEEVLLLCQSYGSRPTPQLNWYWQNQRISDSHIKEFLDNDKNLTQSILKFVPTIYDNGAMITCEAINNLLPIDKAISYEIKINVNYAPIIDLILVNPIPKLTIDDKISEYDSIFIEHTSIRLQCRIDANPYPTDSVNWYFNDTLIEPNNKSGFIIIINEFNYLAIDNLNYQQHNGYFYCTAENFVGFRKSNDYFVRILYAPKCGQEQSYKVGINQTSNIVCNVDAKPQMINFTWFFNGAPINHLNYTTTNSLQSVLTIKFNNRSDFGQYLCLAENMAGISQPCKFQVIPYGRPESVTDCNVVKSKKGNRMLKCRYHFNGGIETFCQMEVYRLNDSVLIANKTDDKILSNQQDYCIFYPLEFNSTDSVRIMVRSFNVKGLSYQSYELNTSINGSLEWNETNIAILDIANDTGTNDTKTQSYFVLFENLEYLFDIISETPNWIFFVIFLIFTGVSIYVAKLALEIQAINRKEHLEEPPVAELQPITPPLAFRDSPMPRLQRKMAIRRRSTSKPKQSIQILSTANCSNEREENRNVESGLDESRLSSSSLPDLFDNCLINTKYLQVRFDRCRGKPPHYHYSIDLNENNSDEFGIDYDEPNDEDRNNLEFNQLNNVSIFLSDSESEFYDMN